MDFSPEGSKAIPMWVNGHAFLTVSDAFHEVINPVTAEAVAAARAAQSSWAEMGMQARRICLGRLADGLENYAGHFAQLLMAETGFDEARANGEVAVAVGALRLAAVGETGVIALAIDDTRPLAGLAEALAPALMAGATVVVKPSIKAPSVAYALCELTARAEWPAGVVNLIQGDAAAIDGLCAAAIDRLVYSGENALGAKIGEIATLRGMPFEMLAG
jgi:succinate-semialdehyde dehydrogenase / glutarate-semialdehyde dehydrogenase